MPLDLIVILIFSVLFTAILYVFNSWVINTARTVPFSLSEIISVGIITILIDAFVIFVMGSLLITRLLHLS